MKCDTNVIHGLNAMLTFVERFTRLVMYAVKDYPGIRQVAVKNQRPNDQAEIGYLPTLSDDWQSWRREASW